MLHSCSNFNYYYYIFDFSLKASNLSPSLLWPSLSSLSLSPSLPLSLPPSLHCLNLLTKALCSVFNPTYAYSVTMAMHSVH